MPCKLHTLVRHFNDCCKNCRWFFNDRQYKLIKYLFIKLSDDAFHVGHTAVTFFKFSYLEDFVVSVVWEKMFRQQRQNFFSDICGNIFAEVWVEPHDISLSLFLAVIVVTIWGGLRQFLLNGAFKAMSV